MNTLAKFVAEQNKLNAFWDPAAVGVDVKTLTAEQAQALYDRLQTEMSPEVLHMDGERRGAKLAARKTLIYGSYKDLMALVETKGWTITKGKYDEVPV